MLGKAYAWLRAASRLLPQGFDALFAAGIGLTSRNGGNRHPALSKKTPEGKPSKELLRQKHEEKPKKKVKLF